MIGWQLTTIYDKTDEIVHRDHEPSYNLQLGALPRALESSTQVLCPKFDCCRFFPWEISLTLALLIHNLRFDLQKMGRTIRFDDGQTRSPIPFHGYSPFSLTISKQFWVFVFSPQPKRCKWLQLWPFISYDRLFLWDYTCYKWGDFSTNTTGITWAMSLCLTEEFAEHLMEILRKGWGSWGRLDSSSDSWSHFVEWLRLMS